MNKKDKERKKTTSCGALTWRVVHEGQVQVLLIKQFAHSDRWGIPKGHQHEGETLEECAIREVKEEAGVEVRLGTALPDVHCSYKDEDKTVKSWLATCVGSQEPNHDDPDSEVADACWFSIDALPELISYQRSLINAAVSGLLREQESSKSSW